MTTSATHASQSGIFSIGGELPGARLGFGPMQLTGKGFWGPPRDRAECLAVVRRAIELGVNLIDTAESYGPHVSEEIIAEALHPYPKEHVNATRGGFDRSCPDKWEMTARPERLREELNGSLKRLRLERIDLWQLHRIDSKVPEAEQFGTIQELQRAGKIRHVGLSEVTVEQIERARKFFPVVSVQNRYNLADREWESVLDHCTDEGIGFIPWFPLQTGKLASAGGPLAKVAQAHQATPAQIALAWLLRRSSVMLPIPGTSKVSHLEENMAGGSLSLSDGEGSLIALT